MRKFCIVMIGLLSLSISTLITNSQVLAQEVNTIITNLTVGGGQQTNYSTITTAIPGDVINFRVYIQNVGTSSTPKVEVEDTLDSRLKYVAASSRVYTKQDSHDIMYDVKDALIKNEGQMLRWGFGNMPVEPANALYLTYQARLADASAFALGTSKVQNHVVVSFADGRKIVPSVAITVVRYPDPTIRLLLRSEVSNASRGPKQWSGDGEQVSVSPGDTVKYRLIAINEGNVSAKDVFIKDVLPPGMTLAGSCKIYDDNHPDGAEGSNADLTGNGVAISEIPSGNSHSVTVLFTARQITIDAKRTALTNTGQVIHDGKVADEQLLSTLPVRINHK